MGLGRGEIEEEGGEKEGGGMSSSKRKSEEGRGWGRERERKNAKDELPRTVGAQYATGDQWRNISRKNEETE